MAIVDLSPGSLLNGVIAASSAGTVIRLSTGSYTGNITLKDDVHIMAAYGQTPVITGEILSAPSGSAVTTIRGCTLSWSTHVLTPATSLRFEYCKFTYTGVFIEGGDVGTYMFVGCEFDGVTFEAVGAALTIHGCYCTDGMLVDCGATDVTITYNTAVGGTWGSNITVIADTLTAENNVFVTTAASIGYFTANSGSISYNVYADTDDLETAGNCTATGNRAVTDVRLRTSGRLRDSSPARAIGGAPSADLPFGRNRLALGADAGCFAFHGHTTAVYAHWTLSDPTYGLNLSDVARGSFSVTPAPATFVSPFDIGEYIHDLVFGFFTGTGFTWGVLEDGSLQFIEPFRSATGDANTNNHAAAMFGVIFETAVDRFTLPPDQHLLLTDLAWEAPITAIIPATVDRLALGAPSGEILPTDSGRRYCSFRVDTRDASRTVFNLWFSGAPVRVFRRLDETDPWSTTNDEGYDDIISLNLDTGDYPWYTPTIEKYEVTFEGVAKDRSYT